MSIRTSRLSRRSVIRLPLLVALGTALAACAPAAAPTATTAPAKPAEKPAAAPAPTNTPAAAAAAKPTEAPKPAEPTKPAAAEATKPAEAAKPAASKAPAEIRMGTWASAGLLDVMKAQIADFEGRNAGNQIKIEAAPWQQYWDKMQVQVAGGTTPDVVWMSGATFLDLNDKGAFKDLMSYAKDDKSLKLEEMWNEPLYTAGGKLWAMPYTASVHALFYNKTMLKEAGIAEPPKDWDDPGWTWDDLRKASKTLTGKGKDGKQRWGIEMTNSMEWGWGTYTLSNGAEVLNKDLTASVMDSPEFIGAIQYVVDMIQKEKVSPVPGDPSAALGPNIIDLFHSGQVAFRNGNNSRIPTYVQIKDFEWDVCVPPRAAPGKPRRVYWVQNPYCMASASKVPDNAWQFLSYVGSKPGQDFMGKSKIIMPSLKSAATDPETYLKPPPNNTRIFPDAMAKNVTTDLQFTKTWLRYQQIAKEQLDPAYLGEKPVDESCRAAKREVDKVLKG
ncbi:MAG TPA: sugar ABC transporter substrate-binding protein [Chloroflexota bacterium]